MSTPYLATPTEPEHVIWERLGQEYRQAVSAYIAAQAALVEAERMLNESGRGVRAARDAIEAYLKEIRDGRDTGPSA